MMAELIQTCQLCAAPVHYIRSAKGRLRACNYRPVTVMLENGQTVKGYLPHAPTCTWKQPEPEAPAAEPAPVEE
jgi:hypothetical protein